MTRAPRRGYARRMAITVGEVTRTLSWSIQGAPEAARRLAAKYLDGCAAAGGAP